MSIDEVACRLDRVQQDPAVAERLGRSIKREIQAQVGECLTSSIGISANKLLAKMASDMQKPDGLVILPVEKLPGAILHLNLRDIPGIGPPMAARLQRGGISDLAALWNTRAGKLRLVWGGVGGARMHELLHGVDAATDVARKHQPSACAGAGGQKHSRCIADHATITGPCGTATARRRLLLPSTCR
jgi:DNA polymerase IV